MSEMSIGHLEPIPEGFLARLLGEFGLQWTHLVILSGIVFSSFGLQEYLNAGVWILGTIGSFSVVFLFRRQITGNFPKTALWAGTALVLGLLVPWAALLVAHQDLGAFMGHWVKLASLYVSAAVGIPVGVLILSYRAQDDFRWSPLPPGLAKAEKSVSQSDFIHESVKYIIQFRRETNGDVIMRFDVTMSLLNRTKKVTPYQDYFDPAGRAKKFMYAEIDKSQINTDDPGRKTERGLLLSHDAQPNQQFSVRVIGESTFYGRDSELVGAYFPCESLSIRIEKPPNGLTVHVESLLREKVDAKPLPTGDLDFAYMDGILPFQGTRIFWESGAG